MTDDNRSHEALIQELIESRKKIARLEFLAEVSHTLYSTLDLNSILSTVTRLCCEAIDATSVYVGTNDMEAGTTTVIAEYIAETASDKEKISDLGVAYDLEEHFPFHATWVRNQTDYYVIQVDEEVGDEKERGHLAEYGAKSALVVRFMVGEDFGGYIELWDSRQKREFDKDEIDLIQSVAKQVSIVTVNAQLYKTLNESKDRYRVISELVADYAYRYTLDDDGTWRRVWTTEAAFKRLTGYERDEIAGTYDLYHPDEYEQVARDVASTLRGETTERDYRIITKNGELGWINVHRQPEWDETGQRVIGFYGSARDITLRKQVEEQLIKFRIQSDRVQLLEELVSDLSHDIKTPLSSIKNYLYLIKKQSNPDKQLEYMNHMETQITRLSQLIEDILTMSQLDKGANLQLSSLRVNDLLEDIGIQYRNFIEQKEISLVFDLNPSLPFIDGNQTELTRAFTNLIVNAVFYTPSGNSITVRSYSKDKLVIIEISDKGIGISESDLPFIFDRFYRADKARNTYQGGSGLGLAIVKKIIDLHGGKITVSSVLEEGSSFIVHLPVSQAL